MNKHIKNIIDYSEGHLIGRNRKRFEKELRNNEELNYDYYLFKLINESMKGRLDLEEVRNDPALDNLAPVVENMITDYFQNSENYRGNQKFVKDSLISNVESEAELIEEISQIKKEIKEYNVDELAEKWVNEWNEKKENLKAKNPNTARNRDFITSSLKQENVLQDLEMSRETKIDKRKYMIRFVELSVAAVITAFALFKVLVPSDNLEKLYMAYYKPMGAFSSVTRNVNTNLSVKYAEAVEMYKQANYQTASTLFFNLMQQDSSAAAPRFFAGITQMELGNYSQAVDFLSGVTTLSGEYRKEAQWYLGLSYLKLRDRSKAIGCFEVLASSEGFYKDQARNLLRRLK